MGWLSSKKLYQNVFKNVTEDVRNLRVMITFKNGESCFINISGYLQSTVRESNPLNNQYYTTQYQVVTAREALHTFLDNTSEWIVSEDDVYFNIEINPIRKVDIVADTPKQDEIKLYAGTCPVGEEDE